MKSSGNIISGKYNFWLVLLILLLAGVSLLLGWLAFELKAWMTFYNVLVVWFIIGGLLFFHVRKINRDVNRFFGILQDQDTVQRFDPGRADRTFRNLYMRMNNVIENLSRIKTQRETDNLFFRAVIDHAETGLLVIDDRGKIILMNKAAGDLLGKTNIIEISDTGLPEDMKPGMKSLLKIDRNGDTIQLSVRSSAIRTDAGYLTLISLQNIRQELEQHEIEAWQKLIRVFIHEIMNSVGPITLTSSAIIGIMENETNIEPKRKDIIDGLKAIRNRSKGISVFMDAYRQLSGTPVPDFNYVAAEKIINDVTAFLSGELIRRSIAVTTTVVPREVHIRCDEKLIEQVLINLIKNSVDALTGIESPQIRISCVALHGRTEIQVQDNGNGIDSDILDNIFVPFFTTKAEGTGIGLSLSRQIMNLHSGSIFVNSTRGNTVFTLSFTI